MQYECKRRKYVMEQRKYLPYEENTNEWESIDSNLVESMLEVAPLINKIAGVFDRDLHGRPVKELLEEGAVITLTNFYVRAKQSVA